MSLHGDGISDEFYFLLWAKDELKYGPSINIPDTVIYKFGQPVAWYFTSVDGNVRKKNKHNLVNIRIEEAFTKYVMGGDIVAYYISLPTTGFDDDTDPETRIEYFDRKGLHDFLYNRWKESNGILQRFIEPKGTQNSMIRAIWSPKVCLAERRQNVRQIFDRRFGLYERAVTYEGQDYHSQAAPLRGNILVTQIQRLCEEIVEHVAEVTFQKQRIARFVINFKVDARDKLYLLWTSSIRLEDGSGDPPVRASSSSSATRNAEIAQKIKRNSLNIDPQLKLPKYIKLADKANHSIEQPGPIQYIDCISCGTKRAVDCFHDLSYKAVMSHYESLIALLSTTDPVASTSTATFRSNKAIQWPPDPRILDAAGGVGFGCLDLSGDEECEKRRKKMKGKRAIIPIEEVAVPPIIQHLHPKLTQHAYKRYKKDPLFSYKNVIVCEECFLVYAEFANSTFNTVGGPLGRSSTMALHNPSLAAMFGRRKAPAGFKHHCKRPASAEDHHSEHGGKVNKDRLLLEEPYPSSSASSLGRPAILTPSVPEVIHNIREARQEYGEVLDRLKAPPSREATPEIYVEEQERIPPPHENIEEVIKSREDAFFKDVYKSRELGKHHPLKHLITAYKRLAGFNAVDNGTAANKHKNEKYSPYTTQMTLSSPSRKKAQHSTAAAALIGSCTSISNGGSSSMLYGSTTAVGSSASKTTSLGATGNRASSQHQEFLMKTLADVQKQLHSPGALTRSILQSINTPPTSTSSALKSPYGSPDHHITSKTTKASSSSNHPSAATTTLAIKPTHRPETPADASLLLAAARDKDEKVEERPTNQQLDQGRGPEEATPLPKQEEELISRADNNIAEGRPYIVTQPLAAAAADEASNEPAAVAMSPGAIPVVPQAIRLSISTSPCAAAAIANELLEELERRSSRPSTAQGIGQRGSLVAALHPPELSPVAISMMTATPVKVKPDEWRFEQRRTSSMSSYEGDLAAEEAKRQEGETQQLTDTQVTIGTDEVNSHLSTTGSSFVRTASSLNNDEEGDVENGSHFVQEVPITNTFTFSGALISDGEYEIFPRVILQEEMSLDDPPKSLNVTVYEEERSEGEAEELYSPDGKRATHLLLSLAVSDEDIALYRTTSGRKTWKVLVTERHLGLPEFALRTLPEEEKRQQALRACKAVKWGGDDESSYAFLDVTLLAAIAYV